MKHVISMLDVKDAIHDIIDDAIDSGDWLKLDIGAVSGSVDSLTVQVIIGLP